MSVTVEKLQNGITVATDRMPEVRTAAIGIWIAAGARFEENDEHGISHLLEHMAFKGTSRRTAREISEQIESVGGELNASTGVETTGYFARLLGEDVPLALDILTDILADPKFERAELAREQSVIVQEIGGAQDVPDDFVFDLFQETAFPGQAIGRPILGTPKTVRGFTPEKLRAYMAKRYRAPRVIVAAGGAVDHASIAKAAGSALKKLPGGEPPPSPAAQYRGGIALSARKLEQTHVVLGLEGTSYLAADRYAMQVFTNLVGGGASSRLFQEAREKRGLCYSIQAFHASYQDTGVFGVTAGTDSADTEQLIRVVVDEIQEAARSATEAEIDRAKAQMKVGLWSSLESASSRTEQLAGNLLAYGRAVPPEEVVQQIEAVTVEGVRAAGRKLVEGARPTFVGVGPKRGLERAGKVVESLHGVA
jgi:predicted Zn-dependent peptidase